MQPLTMATLTTVVSDVLGNLAFMFTDDDEVASLSIDQWLETTISYHGPENGMLRLACTSGFGILLAANLLGVEPEDDDAESKARDAVKEFMNIVCGQLITEIHGTESVFDLTIPEIRELTEAPDRVSVDDPFASSLNVEGYRIQLHYTSGGKVDGQ